MYQKMNGNVGIVLAVLVTEGYCGGHSHEKETTLNVLFIYQCFLHIQLTKRMNKWLQTKNYF